MRKKKIFNTIIRKKYTLYKRYKYSNLHYDYQNYIKARNEAKRQIKKAVREHEKKIACESKTNPKSFWKYVNTKLKRTTGINNLMKPDGTLTDSDSEKANILNNFFLQFLLQKIWIIYLI